MTKDSQFDPGEYVPMDVQQKAKPMTKVKEKSSFGAFVSENKALVGALAVLIFVMGFCIWTFF